MEVMRAQKPLLRGYLHLAAAVCSPAAMLYLLWLADSPREYVGVAIFGVGMCLLFTISAAYHIVPWPRSAFEVVRRMDHAMIFLFVAATYAPFCLVVLGPGHGLTLLAIIGALSLMGAVRAIAWPDIHRWLNLATYLVVGWAAIGAAPVLVPWLRMETTLLLLAGGILYSIGGACHAARWPNPLPRIFGHHEIFHAAVILATGLMYVAVVAEVGSR